MVQAFCNKRILILHIYVLRFLFLYRNLYTISFIFTECLHCGLHRPNLAPRNTALFYEEEEEDIEDEDDIVDDDDDSGMVMNHCRH